MKSLIFFYQDFNRLKTVNDVFSGIKDFYEIRSIASENVLLEELDKKKYDYIVHEENDLENIKSRYTDTEFMYYKPEDLDEPVQGSESYNTSFYTLCKIFENPSAEIACKIIKDVLEPENIIDIGCGCGIYIEQFQKLNIDSVG